MTTELEDKIKVVGDEFEQGIGFILVFEDSQWRGAFCKVERGFVVLCVLLHLFNHDEANAMHGIFGEFFLEVCNWIQVVVGWKVVVDGVQSWTFTAMPMKFKNAMVVNFISQHVMNGIQIAAHAASQEGLLTRCVSNKDESGEWVFIFFCFFFLTAFLGLLFASFVASFHRHGGGFSNVFLEG